MIIGIDLGTTYSLAAVLVDGQPQQIPNLLGEFLTPSVVAIDERDQLLVGRAAKEYQVLHPECCAALFKRNMGAAWSTELGGRMFTPEELSACVLASLKSDAERFLGKQITRAVISVPAYFNETRRRATMRAGEIAGLKVERIINEPTAAAIAYGLHDSGQEKTMLVFDLGGGTFDVSIVEVFEGVVEVRASSGESFLGGEDFSRTMAARILQRHGKRFEHAEVESPQLVSRLIQQCERAKVALTTRESAPVALPDEHGWINEDSPRTEVTRDEFEKWTASLLAQTELPLRRCLADAGLKREQIDEIVLVGGATRMPAVVGRVKELFGKEPACRLDPDRVVALGAAIQAGLIAADRCVEDLVVTDVAPFTLGMEIAKSFGVDKRLGYYLPIINRNTTIPVSRVERVSTIQPNSTQIWICVYQGEARRVEDNLLLGKFLVEGIPRGPAGQHVDVRFTYDSNGVLEVEATIVATGRRASLIVTQGGVELTPQEMQHAAIRLAELKAAVRDNYENSYILKRAERVYQELPLFARDMLGAAMDAFEASLIAGVPSQIAACRQDLGRLLGQLDADAAPGEENADEQS
jgi:molecular chaperone HscC